MSEGRDQVSIHRESLAIGCRRADSRQSRARATTRRPASCPGDPLRAKYIAETYFDNAVQRNAERGLLGYTGEYEGRPVSVQATGMGCPTAAIVMEELVQLGVKRFLRVGTCGGLQHDLELGDLIVALTAVPGRRHRPPLREPASRIARPPTGSSCTAPSTRPRSSTSRCASARSRPRTRSTTPTTGRHARWSSRGVLAVEMEAAVIFTLGALRKVQAGCLLTVSDIVIGGEFTRISDEDLQAAVDRMTPRRARRRSRRAISETAFLVNPASDNGATGKRWPEIARLAAERGLTGDTFLSERPGHLAELAREAAAGGARLLIAVGGDGTVNEVVNGIAGLRRRRAGGRPPRHRRRFRPHLRDPAQARGCARGRAREHDPQKSTSAARLPHVGGPRGDQVVRERRQRRHERRRRQARQRDRQGARRKGLVRLEHARGLRALAERGSERRGRRREAQRPDVRRDRRQRPLPGRRHEDHARRGARRRRSSTSS